MKLFSKQRLQISQDGQQTVIRWWSLNTLEIFLMFLLVIAVIWGFGSFAHVEEIISIKVIPMGAVATLIYWLIWMLVLFHLVFNRSVKLEICVDALSYKRRLIPGVSRRMTMGEIADVRIEEIINNLAERPPDGRDLTSYHLLIISDSDKKIKIKGLSKADAETIQNKIAVVRSV